jgi:hypothetical protein
VTAVQVTGRFNRLWQLDLEWQIVLIFQDFLFDQETTAVL